MKKPWPRAKIIASALVTLKGGLSARFVFVRDRRKIDWRALISTDLNLSDEDTVRICGKHRDFEVFFKMAKQNLKLAKEMRCRDSDALVAQTTIVFLQYLFFGLSTSDRDR